MRTPYRGGREPFELRSDVILFHDWRYVHHGAFRWGTEQGEIVPMWGIDPAPPALRGIRVGRVAEESPRGAGRGR